MMRTGGSTYEDLSLAAARLFLTIVQLQHLGSFYIQTGYLLYVFRNIDRTFTNSFFQLCSQPCNWILLSTTVTLCAAVVLLKA